MTQVLCYESDIANEASVIALASQVQTTFGSLDVAVINAGTSLRFVIDETGKKRFTVGILEQSTEDYMRLWNISFTGTYVATRAFLPLLQQTKDGAQALVCVSSSASHITSTSLSPFVYNFSKFAVNRLVETVHEAHHKDGVVVYALHPGAIPTPMNTDYPQEWDASECCLHKMDWDAANKCDIVLRDDVSLPGGFCVWLTKTKRG